MTCEVCCELCARHAPVQLLWLGDDTTGQLYTACEWCAGNRWRRALVTPALAAVLDEVEAYLDEQADADVGEVIDGVPLVHGNEALRLLVDLRAARG
jgi:hypothetical protein